MGKPYCQKLAAEAAADADNTFANFHLVNEGPDRWLFKNRDRELSWMCWFRVAVVGRVVVVTGDIGEVIFDRGPDTLAWLCGVTNRGADDEGRPIGISYGYVGEKVAQDCSIHTFQRVFVDRYVETLRERRAEMFADDEDIDDTDADVVAIDEAIEEFDDEDIGSAGEFYSRLAALDYDDDEPPEVEGLSRHFLFQVHAVRWFCAALMASQSDDSLDCSAL